MRFRGRAAGAYRLWTRSEFVLHPGHLLVRLTGRTAITKPGPSLLVPSTTKPRGTSADGLSARCMTLIPFVEPTQASARIAPKVSQSHDWTRKGGRVWMRIDIEFRPSSLPQQS